MSLEDNKAVVHRFVEELNKQNLGIIDELMEPDFIDKTIQLQGLKVFKQFYTQLLKGFPDFNGTIEDIIAEGDKVWVRMTSKGTHLGELSINLPSIGKITLAPTGKKITVNAINIWRIINNKFVERETVYDFLNFYNQLGIIDYKVPK